MHKSHKYGYDYNDVYYKIYQRQDGTLTIACMQWFDEYDYDQDRFFPNDKGEPLKFYSEDEAIEWLNENIKPELIDSQYRKIKFNREKYFK